MWPPIEMFGIRNVMPRLSSSVMPRPDCIGSIPRARSARIAAPISPKTAPEAPTVTASARAQRAERAAQQRDEVDRPEAQLADLGLEHRPEEVQEVHVEGEVQDAGVQEPGADDPPPLAVGDERAEQGAVGVDRAAAGRSEAAAARTWMYAITLTPIST